MQKDKQQYFYDVIHLKIEDPCLLMITISLTMTLKLKYRLLKSIYHDFIFYLVGSQVDLMTNLFNWKRKLDWRDEIKSSLWKMATLVRLAF